MRVRFSVLLGTALWVVWSAIISPAHALLPPSYIVFFSSESTEIQNAGNNVLREVVSTFHKIGDQARVLISAHIDSAEAKSGRMTLPADRGEAVKQRLVELGIPADRLLISVRGDSQPLVVTSAGVAEPQNRRVELVVMREEKAR